MQGLWINDILGITSANLESGSMENESFVLLDDDEKKIGMLWMGKTKDQFTCDDRLSSWHIHRKKTQRQRIGKVTFGICGDLVQEQRSCNHDNECRFCQ